MTSQIRRRILIAALAGATFAALAVTIASHAGIGTGLTQLTHEPADNPSFLPDWSPDGRQIAFSHFLATGFFTQLGVINADGSDEHVIWQGADFSYGLGRQPLTAHSKKQRSMT